MSKVRRDPIARAHCSRGFPLTSFTFSCRDGSHACFAYNQRLERSEAIERLERFETAAGLPPAASRLLYYVLLLADLAKNRLPYMPNKRRSPSG
jgi:hypothetical protein